MRADDLLAYLRSARSNVAATDRYWRGRGPEGSGPCCVNPQAPREVARRSVKVAGAGFEPANSERLRLQRSAFDHFATPPGGGQCNERSTTFDLVLGVFGAAEEDRRRSFNCRRRDEPAASVGHENEELIAALLAEPFDDLVPALIAAPRAERDAPAVVHEEPGRLHLDPRRLPVDQRDEIHVWTVADGDEDWVAARRQPLDGGILAEVALLAWIHRGDARRPRVT